MENLLNYVVGVLTEGLVVGVLFWGITYITIESTSLRGALRAGWISELVGNIPYLAGVEPLDAPSLAMAVLGAFIFVRMILRVGELTLLNATYGVAMTYFALIAIVSCA